jgi:hypothetical protein
MDATQIDTVVDAAGRPRPTEATVRRRRLVGPGAVPGRQLVLTAARRGRRDRSKADRPAAGGSAGLF